MSTTFSNVKDTKKIEEFLVENIMENHYEYEDKKPPHHSEAGQIIYLQQNLNSINAFLMSLVMSYVGSRFKLLTMSWYKNMIPFRTNFKLFIKKILCGVHDYFPGVDSSSNDDMLSRMSTYICF